MGKSAAGWLLLFFSVFAFAQPEVGRDYLPIDPPLQPATKKIELLEFFYYGCPECSDLEPFLQEWLNGRNDVEMVRVPAFRSSWLPLARTYYALRALGQENRLRGRIFSAIRGGTNLNDEHVLFVWIGRRGVDLKKFESIYASKEVQMKISESVDLAMHLGIAGVPALVVDGKYLVMGDLARGDLLDQLVDMAKHRRMITP